jgi:ATP-dependent Clp protease ATP-binding subunit ClpX
VIGIVGGLVEAPLDFCCYPDPAQAIVRLASDLTFQDEALNVVAKKAIERRAGARGLRSIMEGILLDTMFELPGLDGVEQVVIGPEVVDGKASPLYIYSAHAEKAG